MKQWPSNIQKLIRHFGRLPGIGPKMAERIVLSLIGQRDELIKDFAQTLTSIHTVTHCSECCTLSEKKLCDICGNPERDKRFLLVVADAVSVLNIEHAGNYNGRYFVLNGLLNPLEGITPDKLNIEKLIQTIKKTPELKEVILGFNANVEGEATLLYLKKLLVPYKHIALTRLARGLPMGSELTYADEITLSAALTGRQKV